MARSVALIVALPRLMVILAILKLTIGSGPIHASLPVDSICFSSNEAGVLGLIEKTLINSSQLVVSIKSNKNNETSYCITPPEIRPIIKYRRLNPTKYKFLINNVPQEFPLVFSETFAKGWKLYLIDIKDSFGTHYSTNNIDSVMPIEDWLRDKGKLYDTWLLPSIEDKHHWTANGYSNAWWFNSQTVDHYSIHHVQGGSKSRILIGIIEYSPQRVYYLGIFITLLTGCGMMFFLVWRFIKKRRK